MNVKGCQRKEQVQNKMCATTKQRMEEKKQAVKSGKAWSSLFLTLNHDRSTLRKTLRLQT